MIPCLIFYHACSVIQDNGWPLDSGINVTSIRVTRDEMSGTSDG